MRQTSLHSVGTLGLSAPAPSTPSPQVAGALPGQFAQVLLEALQGAATQVAAAAPELAAQLAEAVRPALAGRTISIPAFHPLLQSAVQAQNPETAPAALSKSEGQSTGETSVLEMAVTWAAPLVQAAMAGIREAAAVPQAQAEPAGQGGGGAGAEPRTGLIQLSYSTGGADLEAFVRRAAADLTRAVVSGEPIQVDLATLKPTFSNLVSLVSGYIARGHPGDGAVTAQTVEQALSLARAPTPAAQSPPAAVPSTATGQSSPHSAQPVALPPVSGLQQAPAAVTELATRTDPTPTTAPAPAPTQAVLSGESRAPAPAQPHPETQAEPQTRAQAPAPDRAHVQAPAPDAATAQPQTQAQTQAQPRALAPAAQSEVQVRSTGQNQTTAQTQPETQASSPAQPEARATVQTQTSVQSRPHLASASPVLTAAEAPAPRNAASTAPAADHSLFPAAPASGSPLRPLQSHGGQSTDQGSLSRERDRSTSGLADLTEVPDRVTGSTAAAPEAPAFEQVVSEAEEADSRLTRRPHFEEQEQVLRQVSRSIRVMLDGRRSEVRLQLNPENLGTVGVRLVIQEGSVQAHLTAQDSQVRQVLQANLDQLRTRFIEQGLKVDQVQVSVGGDTQFSQSGNPHRQEQQQFRQQDRGFAWQQRQELALPQDRPERPATSRIWTPGRTGARLNSLA